jgi:hypothetical protein
MPAGARLRLDGISPRVQQARGLSPTADVVMIRCDSNGRVHRDGVRFADGQELLLQSLNPGVSATLLPRDLEAVFDLKSAEPVAGSTRSAATPVAAAALARFPGYLAWLRLRTSARRRGDRSQTARCSSTIDA